MGDVPTIYGLFDQYKAPANDSVKALREAYVKTLKDRMRKVLAN